MPTGPSAPPVRKYQQVYEALWRDIRSGRLQAGDRLPSEAQLVVTFGASRITVGRALRDLQHEGLVERRAGSGTYVRRGRVPVGEAAALTFGLLIPDLGETEILEPICQGLTSAPEGRRHAVIWGDVSGEGAEKEAAALDLCRQYVDRRVAGVFFAPLELTPSKDAVNRQIAGLFDAAGIPLVLLDRSVEPYGQREAHDLVGIDNRRAGFRMTTHLLGAGAVRVGFVALANAASTVDARLAGYREALHAHGAPVDPRLVLRAQDVAGDVPAFARDMRPDAIVCANDHTAALVMHALIGAGLSIPGDVRLAGIDDVQYAALLPVRLTTLRQPCREIGAAAMAAMLDRVAHLGLPPRDIFLHPTLVVRRSCGAVAATV